MRPKLTNRSIRYIIGQMKKGRKAKDAAKEMNVTRRHFQRLWAGYRKTGTMPVLGSTGRPKEPGPSDEEIQAVLDAYRRRPEGVLRVTGRLLRDGRDIRYNRVYEILKSNGLVAASPAKSKQRKRVRYERLYSNAMWHTDWHAMKDPHMKGLNLVTYLDDASRCVTGAALF